MLTFLAFKAPGFRCLGHHFLSNDNHSVRLKRGHDIPAVSLSSSTNPLHPGHLQVIEAGLLDSWTGDLG